MFSTKNYGLPKELIEAAKRVHEKQLEEQQVPKVRALEGSPRIKPSDASPETIRAADKNEKEAKMSSNLRKLGDNLKKEREKKRNHPTYIQSRYHKGDTYEEVQFTEEELAEAFAIFLEENFHVEMLTEEDLDYVFENEFPQWLEEARNAEIIANTKNPNIKRMMQLRLKRLETGTGPGPEDRATSAGTDSVPDRYRKPPSQRVSRPGKSGLGRGGPVSPGEDAQIKIEKEKSMTGGLADGAGAGKPPVTSSVTPTAPKSTARNQVSAKPAASARRQTGAPKGSFTAYRKSLGLGGNLEAARSERYKEAYRTYKAASPKRDWRTRAFNPDGN